MVDNANQGMFWFYFKPDFEFRIKVLSLRHKIFNNCLSFKFKQNASKN